MKQSIIIIVMALTALCASAQSNINRAIAQIEKSKTTQYVAYSENRDPESHALLKSSKVLVINAANANKFIEAFNRDREKATSVQMTQNRVFEARFTDGKKRSCYTLIKQRDGSWLLTVEIKTVAERRGRRTAYIAGEPGCLAAIPEIPGIVIPDINIPEIVIPEVVIPEVAIPDFTGIDI